MKAKLLFCYILCPPLSWVLLIAALCHLTCSDGYTTSSLMSHLFFRVPPDALASAPEQCVLVALVVSADVLFCP